MTIEYQHPQVIIDGSPVGEIVSALLNYPQLEAAILIAHNAAWETRQGEVDQAATEAAVEAAATEAETLRAENSELRAKVAELEERLKPPAMDWRGLSRGFKASALGLRAARLSQTNLPVNSTLTWLVSYISDGEDDQTAAMFAKYFEMLQAIAGAGETVPESEHTEIRDLLTATGFPLPASTSE